MQTLTDQESYKQYTSAIGTSHVDLNWFKYGDEHAIKKTGQSSMEGMGLWADEPEPVEIAGAPHDNFMLQHRSTLIVMIAQKENIADQQADYQACEGIAKDIISKMILDYQNGDINIQINRFKFGEAVHAFSATKYTACRLDIFWEESADLTYNEAKWQ